MVGIYKCDSYTSHLEGAVQWHNVEVLGWHLQPLLDKSRCDRRAVNGA